MVSRLFRHASAGALSIGILAGCGGGGFATLPVTSSSIDRPSGYVLTWSDEFDQGNVLNSDWTYDLGEANFGGSNWGNAELQYYTSDAANVRLEGGHLVIQAVAGKPAGVRQFGNILATSARVTTDTPSFYSALGNQPYGYYEIKAQIPCVAGAWPAIWMMGKAGNWPDRGELDIMEWFGRYFAAQPDQVQSGVHTRAGFGGDSTYQKLQLSGLCQGFHRFQLHWETSRLTFGVDDQVILIYDKPVNATNDNWPFDQPAHLLLNVAVGGNLGGDVDVANIPAMRMLVDYVKVWQPR
jgi:beta-glucanase (GH16 family)